jgi:hypothetical protein
MGDPILSSTSAGMQATLVLTGTMNALPLLTPPEAMNRVTEISW